MTVPRALLARVIRRVAPEVDLDALDPDAPLQDEIAIDSVDFLRLVDAMGEEAGIDVPERDYVRLSSVRGFLDYIADRIEDADR